MIDTISNYLSGLTAEHYFFFLFAIVAIASSLEVVMQRSPLYSAVALIFTMAALAANFVLLKAQFLAAIQIIVYAGAIIVLFVFVIMLLNVRAEESRLDRFTALRWVAAPSAIVLFAGAFAAIRFSNLDTLTPSPNASTAGTTEAIASVMFTKYLLPFEAASVLIMMAIVGALVLSARAKEYDAELAGLQKQADEPEPEPEVEPEEVEVS